MSIAGAEPPSVVSIDYAAPADCPRADVFATELIARTPRTRVVAPGGRVRTLVVRLAARGRAFGGSLILREPSGAETERAVTADTCAEAASALALIAAIAVDPFAVAGTPAASASTAMATAAATTTSDDASPGPPPDAAPLDATPPENARLDERPRGDGGEVAVATPTPSRWGWAVGAHAGVVRGVSPDMRVLLPFFAEIADETGGLFAPALRLRLERTLGGTGTSSGASGDFTWTAASLDLCPILMASGRVGARPCLRVEAGALEARGVDVIPSRHGTSPWLALGPVARGRVDVAGPLFMELDVAATVALVRDRFFVEPASTVYRAPLVGWAATGGAGVAFW